MEKNAQQKKLELKTEILQETRNKRNRNTASFIVASIQDVDDTRTNSNYGRTRY
jgi:hypothetical protein